MDDWSAKVSGFIRDGIVNHEFYWKSDIKILFLLKEVNGGEDWDLLREQIDMYQPDIIICGGTAKSYFDSITEYSNPDWKQTEHGIWYVVEPTGRIIVEYSHLEARVKDCLLYYGLVDAVKEILYKPITQKIQEWIDYELNEPKGNYNTHKREHNEYRQKNDLDCILTGGNLCADTIFALWLEGCCQADSKQIISQIKGGRHGTLALCSRENYISECR